MPEVLDQFYTIPAIAKLCCDACTFDRYDVILEPSAGTGAFYDNLPVEKREGIDLDPKHPEVKKQNFFDYKPIVGKKYMVVGNPPFGRVSATAIKFFNYAATFADAIAFIIPRTFKRTSVQNALSMEFRLESTMDLPMAPCCFTPPMMAKCCFQIWKRSDTRRTKIINPMTHSDFTFMSMGPLDAKGQPTPPVGADFAIKAYGSGCGFIEKNNLHKLRPKSWHWIKSNIDIDVLIARFNSLDYSVSKDTVRQDSIGRGELCLLYGV
jgi:hypothetical protein